MSIKPNFKSPGLSLAAPGHETPVKGACIPHRPSLPTSLTHRRESVAPGFTRLVKLAPTPATDSAHDYQI